MLYQLGGSGLHRIEYEETEHFQVTRDFLSGRDRFFTDLFADEPGGSDL
jgi:predicted ATPase